MSNGATPIPVTILTGFLGAGKTTLLNRILKADHGLKIAVLVNDFGEINIDSQLVVGVEGDNIVNLANGCICCTIRDDLLTATLDVLARPEQPNYIVIEASGVSDPVAVALTFKVPALRSLLTLDAIVALIDAESVTSQRENTMMVVDQIAASDIVVLNKIDLVTAEHKQGLYAWIRAIVPRARILEAVHADVAMDLLLGVGKYRIDLDQMAVQTHEHDHDHEHDHSSEWKTWHFETDQPLLMTTLQQTFKDLPTLIYRAKGIVNLREAPERRAIVQLAGKRASLRLAEPWGDAPKRSQIVVIGTAAGVDPTDLQRRFAACIAADPSAEPHDEVLTSSEWLRRQS